MPIELWSLVAIAVMAFLTIVVQALQADIKSGVAYVLSNRDGQEPGASPFTGRVARAMNNQLEAAIVWVPLVVVALHLDISNAVTWWASLAMIASRVLYFPFYALGLVPFRSVAWMGFFAGAPAFAIGLWLG